MQTFSVEIEKFIIFVFGVEKTKKIELETGIVLASVIGKLEEKLINILVTGLAKKDQN
jgi:hypothetical protein